MTTSSLPLIFLLLAMFSSFATNRILVASSPDPVGPSNTGLLGWGKACSPSASIHDAPSARCDTSKRLACDMRALECRCYHEERDFYNVEEDRCETKIGKFCSASDTFPTICVKNAKCDGALNFCVCDPQDKPNEMGTECLDQDNDDEDGENGANSMKPLNGVTAFVVMVMGSRWL